METIKFIFMIITIIFGETIARATPHEIQNNGKVIDAYLGSKDIY
ncbi:MAG: hypothetical protein JW864_06720 [Spirochaetes bacterium]|nr:hypothetical protein [Spirochaetota bacterium]